MLLAIDVGNTNIVLGVFDGERLTENWRLATLRERTADEIGILVTHLFVRSRIDLGTVDGIILSSVVPPLTRTMEEMAERFFGRRPLTVDPGVNSGMPVLYSPASDVGADRVVNAVAAYEMCGRADRTPVIVVDFGTATTFDAISGAGEYIGGVICPGIGISADALFQRAARLPRVDVRKPESIIGRTTVTSMQAGLFFGYVAMVDGIVARMRTEMDGGERAACIATGGMAEILAGETSAIQSVVPDLTLQGLRLIWERNRRTSRHESPAVAAMDPAEYCREVETYLCRKNEGHLVRIVGPAFERVCGWAAAGVPLKVALRGIDRYCERYYAKGPKRRPVRIEFCEADILDLFDDWRRAVGVSATTAAAGEATAPETAPRKASLASHIERVVARLTGARAGGRRSPVFDAALAAAVRELDGLAPDAGRARGEGRTAIVEHLARIDSEVLGAALQEIDATTAAQLRRESDAELAPFGSRLAPEARARAAEAAYARLVRDAFGIPVIEYRMSLTAGQELDVHIEKPAAGGRMIARHEGQIVLVLGGDSRRAGACRRSSASTSAWRSRPSPRILEPRPTGASQPATRCAAAASTRTSPTNASVALKADIVARRVRAARAHPARRCGRRWRRRPTEGYRMRARLHVRGGRVGFYREGTHELCDAASTGQLAAETLALRRSGRGGAARRGRRRSRAVEVSREHRRRPARALFRTGGRRAGAGRGVCRRARGRTSDRLHGVARPTARSCSRACRRSAIRSRS